MESTGFIISVHVQGVRLSPGFICEFCGFAYLLKGISNPPVSTQSTSPVILGHERSGRDLILPKHVCLADFDSFACFVVLALLLPSDAQLMVYLVLLWHFFVLSAGDVGIYYGPQV